MNLNRRQFLLLTGTAATVGCHSQDGGGSANPGGQEHVADAGSAANYSSDGVFNAFQEQGFFVVREGEKLFALSSFCTHKKCRLSAEPDGSFRCKCHGSTFDPGGLVTRGPAKRDLPVFSASVDEKGHLLVKFPGS